MMKRKLKHLTADQRRTFIMSLRDVGLSYDKIAAQAIKTFGVDNLPKGYGKRLVCLDLQRALSANSANKLNIALRYKKIAEHRLAGLSYSQILEQLKQEFGANNLPQRYSERHICRDLKRYWAKINAESKQELIDANDLHRQRLNALLILQWPKALQGDPQPINQVLKIIDKLFKLDNLHKVAPSTASSSNNSFNTFEDAVDYFAKP